MLELPGVLVLFTVYSSLVAAGNISGYHYEKPTVSLGLLERPENLGSGHNFPPLPTIQPLPPVPALPALPTGRSKSQFVQTQTIYQTHPLTSGIGKIAQQYQPPLLGQPSITSNIKTSETGTAFSSISEPSAPVRPLRVPFGKQAVISFPSGTATGTNFDPHGRQLHQYAVIEIIDNDIEQSTQPFLNEPFFDTYRAHGATTGLGATPPPLGSRLLGGRSSDLFLGQQHATISTDAVALGSGGLGFIRLANGNVYLGSGSLGYVSGQQHSQEINEARTRTGAPQPDALHFGHGSLGNPGRSNRFSYRFK